MDDAAPDLGPAAEDKGTVDVRQPTHDPGGGLAYNLP